MVRNSVVLAVYLLFLVSASLPYMSIVSGTVKRAYFVKGLSPAVSGIVVGLTLGSLCGESLCGMVLKSFGADCFRFVINWGQVMVGIPAIILGPTILAIWAGISKIVHIKAYECCRGKE